MLIKLKFHFSNYYKGSSQGWAIPGVGQQYYTLYYTWQKYAKLYNTIFQYYTKSEQLISSVKQQQTAIYSSHFIVYIVYILILSFCFEAPGFDFPTS